MNRFLPLAPSVVQQAARFAEAVAVYCDLIEGRECLSVDELLGRVHPLIIQLYGAALGLPRTDILFSKDDEEDDDSLGPREERDPDRLTQEAWTALYRSLGGQLGQSNFYREVFDPWAMEGEEEVIGSLSDDLTDIYGDLSSGLKKWKRGEHSEAFWEWRCNFEIHWGEHAVGAIRAIHMRATNYKGGWPPPTAELCDINREVQRSPR